MGTPAFAVASLRMLVEQGYHVVGVVTTTDKYGGRGGKKLLQSAVKQYALAQDLPILQPKKLKNAEFIAALKAWNANLQVVVAFRILPAVVYEMPAYGTFNLHGSLLPKYRGAAPINWAVIRGETETGVTSFFLKRKVDTGDMIFQEKMPIGENETVGAVHDRMMALGAAVVLKTVQAIEQDTVTTVPQDESLATTAPKIFHETCQINFDAPTLEVHNFIRGLSPYPAAWTMLDGLKLKIFNTTKEIVAHNDRIGTIVTDKKKHLKIATQDGYVQVHQIQLQGRKRMAIAAFLNGYTIVSEKVPTPAIT